MQFRNLVVHHPAAEVEFMNARILEEHAIDAARHVADGWRRLIAAQRLEQHRVADLAGFDAFFGPDVRWIVAAHMPRLQPHSCLRGQAQDLVGLLHG